METRVRSVVDKRDNTKLLTSRDSLSLEWEDGHHSQFHWIWLRDHCRCERCYNASCDQKHYDAALIDPEIRPVRVEDQNDAVAIQWPDEPDACLSVYDKQWLRSHDPSGRAPIATEEVMRRAWDVSLFHSLTGRFECGHVLERDDILLTLLHDLQQNGLVVVRETPHQEDFTKLLARIGGCVTPTVFGPTFDLRSRPAEQMQSVSFSTDALPLHTDIPYYNEPPEYQFLHSVDVVRSTDVPPSGRTMFADGFAAAERLRSLHPDHFETLLTTAVTYRARFPEQGNLYVHKSPMLRIANGTLGRIVSNPTRMFLEGLSFEQIGRFYEAYREFKRLLYAPESLFYFDWSNGDMVVWDNSRIFHGREAFKSPARTRVLRGGYFAWAEIASKYNYLHSLAHP
jgi:gamma-butyrobetaine dioxygenase